MSAITSIPIQIRVFTPYMKPRNFRSPTIVDSSCRHQRPNREIQALTLTFFSDLSASGTSVLHRSDAQHRACRLDTETALEKRPSKPSKGWIGHRTTCTFISNEQLYHSRSTAVNNGKHPSFIIGTGLYADSSPFLF